jgi:hypothetical protein
LAAESGNRLISSERQSSRDAKSTRYIAADVDIDNPQGHDYDDSMRASAGVASPKSTNVTTSANQMPITRWELKMETNSMNITVVATAVTFMFGFGFRSRRKIVRSEHARAHFAAVIGRA